MFCRVLLKPELHPWALEPIDVYVNAPLEEIAWLEPEDEIVPNKDPLSSSDESYHACKEAMEKLSNDVMTLLGEHKDNGKFVSKLSSCIRRLEKDVATNFSGKGHSKEHGAPRAQLIC
ncbi:hypothetical protein R1flu_016394 [Riccia fluitans]|uniref:Uncharacterized protein n=1 Tax=Riccia fluitans TaxID=41844 RepID=A0ABD1YLX6_9MARC